MENEELKDVETTESAPQEAAVTPSQEDAQKSFTQDDVNRIVQERLARERERINSMINEDEGIRKELTANRLKLNATKELNAAGYPIELVDFVDCADEKACKESIKKISKVYDLAYQNATADIYRANGRIPGRGNTGGGAVNDKLRNAFRPKE